MPTDGSTPTLVVLVDLETSCEPANNKTKEIIQFSWAVFNTSQLAVSFLLVLWPSTCVCYVTVYASVCVCVYVCVCVLYVCLCRYMYVCVCICVCVCECVYVYAYVCGCVAGRVVRPCVGAFVVLLCGVYGC